MKPECAIVRDLLPLYLEHMVREETAAFIQTHLEHCADCHAEFDALRTPGNLPAIKTDMPDEEAQALLAVKKKLQKKTRRTTIFMTAILFVMVTLLYHFPFYHIPMVCLPTPNYYDADELAMLAYIGNAKDRLIAQSILAKAEQACEDLTHTYEENKELYGPLSRFAISTDLYPTVVSEDHSIDLWAAHLDDTEGHIWVYYSQEAYNGEGETITGSWRIPSLWHVEKDTSGQWIVTKIKEHP